MSTDGMSGWLEILPPVLFSPVSGAVSAVTGFTIQTSAFVSSADSHVGTDWEVRTAANGAGTAAWSSANDLVGKLLKVVPALALATGQTYYLRARFRGSKFVSPWSAEIRITT